MMALGQKIVAVKNGKIAFRYEAVACFPHISANRNSFGFKAPFRLPQFCLKSRDPTLAAIEKRKLKTLNEREDLSFRGREVEPLIDRD
jgi:hypothetical protein